MAYRIEVYNGEQDLSNFFLGAAERGFYNNSSKEMLIDYIAKYEDSTLFLLYYKNDIVGTSVSHSLKELGILGKDAYRIAARTCLLPHESITRIYTPNQIKTHQGPAPQMLIPVCIEYIGKDKPMYISSNENETGSQQMVHRLYCPLMRKIGILEDPIELEYKGTFQSFWKVNVEEYYRQLEQYSWAESRDVLSVFATNFKKV
jgi:hypothetical protein